MLNTDVDLDALLDSVLSPPTATTGGFIYIIGNRKHQFYKVGASKTPRKRIKYLLSKAEVKGCGYPFVIKTIKIIRCWDFMKCEKSLHAILKRYHQRREWFKLPDPIINILESVEAIESSNGLNGINERVIKA